MSESARPRVALPIDEVMPQIIDELRHSHALVLRAPTGAGKTTRLPPALVAAGLAGGDRIVMLEPRRLAARAAARRIAAEQGWRVGREVGYQIRFERRASADTRILIVTEGVLVQMLQHDPFLEGVAVLIFDEFHERSLDADLALAMARRVQQEARPDLKLVVMSATLDPLPLSVFLGDAPCVDSAGRLYPVAVTYLDRPDPRALPLRAAAAVRQVLPATPGDVLVFLPGVGEIERTREQLAPLAAQGFVRVLPLYGDLPDAQQDDVLMPSDQRKVVLATNVAETSITIDGIAVVIDSGFSRVLRYDPASGLDGLELRRISRASAEQRAGRAGRQGPGRCSRLWTEHDHRSLQPLDVPEIQRVDLAGPALQLFAWGERDLTAFGWFDAPDPAALERATGLLRDLGAIDAGGITARGRAMARLPVHPRLARLLIEGHRLGEPRRAALVASLLAERDLAQRSVGSRPQIAAGSSVSDTLDRLVGLESFLHHGYGETALGPVRRGRAQHVIRAASQLQQRASRVLGSARDGDGGDRDDTDRDDRILRALLAAFPDRVARRRESGSRRAVMVGGRGVQLASTSTVHDSELFLCLDLDAGRGRREALVRQASGIRREWLDPARIETIEEAVFVAVRERVVCRRISRYRDLILAETEVSPRQDEAEHVLAAAAVADLEHALALDAPATAAFLARLRALAGWLPELDLPTFTAPELAALVPSLCIGKQSFAELRRAPLLEVLRGALSYEQATALARHAPEALEVPSGSRIRLRYDGAQPPVLAVRIQELFGLAEAPRVAAGKVPVMLHLLAPNQRPQQVTQDLASFWQNTYPEVRKELQGRYPKHAWPSDPLGAVPERRPRRKR